MKSRNFVEGLGKTVGGKSKPLTPGREGGDWGPSPTRPSQFVRVTFADGNHVDTSINGTEDEVRAYYGVGREFNVGQAKDNMQRVVKVEFPDGVVPAVPYRQESLSPAQVVDRLLEDE